MYWNNIWLSSRRRSESWRGLTWRRGNRLKEVYAVSAERFGMLAWSISSTCLHPAFMLADPKSTKSFLSWLSFFALLGFESVIAARKMFLKLTHGLAVATPAPVAVAGHRWPILLPDFSFRASFTFDKRFCCFLSLYKRKNGWKKEKWKV